jgi:hypothetical protein
VLPDVITLHRELRRKGVTLQLLWEYTAAHPNQPTYRYTQFVEHYRCYARTLKRSMRQQHRAGEKLFIDYAGPTLPVIDAATGEIRQACPQSGHCRRAGGLEPTPVQKARRLPTGLVRATRPAGAETVTGASL